MTVHENRITSVGTYYNYRVGMSQLDRLFGIASEGFDAESIIFETTQGDTSLRRDTLASLVSGVASLVPGNPNWSNLSFRATQGTRDVSVRFTRYDVSVSVSATDPTWVYGQAARLRAILRAVADERAPAERASRTATFAGLISMALLGLLIILSMLAGAELALDEGTPGRFMTGVIAGTLIATISGLTATASVNRSILNPTGEVPHENWWSRRNAMEKISLAGAVIAAAAAVGTLISAYSDMTGKK
ncbi:hypothetical protein JK359_13975 [Streptomyces actinomycinicus]|uniref:Uncharacterized protein n=1 Tax=Streptomyces actinomycinicus TaxID=1695166 RepID=A0A937EID5_9ACTN|nr:hypothetical protein [Streptomyces actinomycinicus]MBL1083078.1 hypothetical protein [Streptomyces actinomycinicus]